MCCQRCGRNPVSNGNEICEACLVSEIRSRAEEEDYWTELVEKAKAVGAGT
jgi:hypothetical protein